MSRPTPTTTSPSASRSVQSTSTRSSTSSSQATPPPTSSTASTRVATRERGARGVAGVGSGAVIGGAPPAARRLGVHVLAGAAGPPARVRGRKLAGWSGALDLDERLGRVLERGRVRVQGDGLGRRVVDTPCVRGRRNGAIRSRRAGPGELVVAVALVVTPLGDQPDADGDQRQRGRERVEPPGVVDHQGHGDDRPDDEHAGGGCGRGAPAVRAPGAGRAGAPARPAPPPRRRSAARRDERQHHETASARRSRRRPGGRRARCRHRRSCGRRAHARDRPCRRRCPECEGLGGAGGGALTGGDVWWSS